MATAPQLGYGKPTEATIDSVNQWMRAQPWYQDQMRAWGQDPGHPTLTKAQSSQILKAAQSQGVVVDEGDMEVDNHGNFNPKGHKLRNTLVVAGIAGAALATAGLAGAFGGAAAGGGSAATGAGSGIAGLGGGVGLGETGAVTGLAGSGFGGAAGAVGAGSAAGAGAGIAGVAPTGGGVLGTASKIADIAGRIGGGVNAVDAALHGGLDPQARGIGAANAAAQAANNRFLAARADQAGPTADKQALENMRYAGLLTSFKDAPASEFGSPAITLNQNTRNMAADFQNEIRRRQAAGKSLTLSGVPDPTAQELEDERQARLASQGKTGNGFIDAVNTGGRLASLAPGIVRTGRDIWNIFS
jgi:hypothetical protein